MPLESLNWLQFGIILLIDCPSQGHNLKILSLYAWNDITCNSYLNLEILTIQNSINGLYLHHNAFRVKEAMFHKIIKWSRD